MIEYYVVVPFKYALDDKGHSQDMFLIGGNMFLIVRKRLLCVQAKPFLIKQFIVMCETAFNPNFINLSCVM